MYRALHTSLLVWLIFVSANFTPVSAREPGGGEPAVQRPFDPEAVKAAFLVNFVRFISWPNEARDAGPFVIVVAGNRPLEDALLRIADRQRVRERSLRIVRLRGPLDLDEAHLVFIEAREAKAGELPLPEATILESLRGKPVLTVGTAEGFLDRGGLVRLFLSGDNLRFTIDAERTAAAGLRASSRLLALGRQRDDGAGGDEPR